MSKIDPKNLNILSQLDLTQTLASFGIDTENKHEKLNDSYNKLLWVSFVETDLEMLSNDDQTVIENFIEQQNFGGLGQFLMEKYPNLKVRIIKNALIAKKKIIIDALDFRISYIKVAAKRRSQEDTSEQLITLQKYALDDNWEQFDNLLNNLS